MRSIDDKVGAALVILFRRNVLEEKDKRTGGIGARQYVRHGHVEPWITSLWTLPDRNGIVRLDKYKNHLNENIHSAQV